MALTDPGENESLTFLRELVQVQRQGEYAVQRCISARLCAIGCVVTDHIYNPADVPVIGEFAVAEASATERRTAIVGTLEGDSDKRSLLMFAHPDSEPVADTQFWSHDPFAGVIEGDRMYGWGIADDLAGCAAAVLAIEKASRAGETLGMVCFASTPSKRYARGVAALLHNDLHADASLYLHPAESGVGMREIKALASGQLEFRITIKGRLPETSEPGHTAFSHLAINPIDKAFALHGVLMKLAAARAERIVHPMLHDAVQRSTNIQVSNIACGTMQKYSRLQEYCQLGGAVSFPPGETYAQVQDEIEAVIAEFADQDDWLRDNTPVVEWLTGVTGAEVPSSHPLYITTASAVQRLTETQPFVNAMHTSSDIRNPAVEKGIPTVGLGCLGGDLTQNGMHDEWINVPDFLKMVDVTAAVVIDWCRESVPV